MHHALFIYWSLSWIQAESNQIERHAGVCIQLNGSRWARAAVRCSGILAWTTDFISFISRAFCTVLWTNWPVVKQAAWLLSTNWWTHVKRDRAMDGMALEHSCLLTTGPIWTLCLSLFPVQHSLKATDQHSDRGGYRKFELLISPVPAKMPIIFTRRWQTRSPNYILLLRMCVPITVINIQRWLKQPF